MQENIKTCFGTYEKNKLLICFIFMRTNCYGLECVFVLKIELNLFWNEV